MSWARLGSPKNWSPGYARSSASSALSPSYQVAQTAFQALAVTEKMTRDAFSLERILRIGVGALLALSLVIAGIFFLYSHRAEKETRRAYLVISQLEKSVQTQ